jgi:hypothetical protein
MEPSHAFDAGTSGHRWPLRHLCSPEPVVSVEYAYSADGCFVDMMRCYRCRGGLARELEVLSLLKHRGPGCGSHSTHPARSIRPRDFERAIRFSWGGWTWLPLFQFRMEELILREEPVRVADALGPEFNGWDVANWFIARNAWLRNQRPIDLIDKELALVIEAARTDRFVATG